MCAVDRYFIAYARWTINDDDFIIDILGITPTTQLNVQSIEEYEYSGDHVIKPAISSAGLEPVILMIIQGVLPIIILMIYCPRQGSDMD